VPVEGVHAHLVAVRDLLLDQAGVGLGGRAHHEERRMCVVGAEHREDLGRVLGAGSVVEREGHLALVDVRAVDRNRPRHAQREHELRSDGGNDERHRHRTENGDGEAGAR